ncbi:hypothetical protein [Streptomyces sp. XH2]|uniref:hypothetical protein n=1 Tax=Streptomyces sp. XH2 TaxID=3412483 RepID=UPI003C7D49A4
MKPTIGRPAGISALDVPLEQVLQELRAAQAGDELAEQRHQFLDLDPDLVRADYTQPAPYGGDGRHGTAGGAR